jgi:hypothetical protein
VQALTIFEAQVIVDDIERTLMVSLRKVMTLRKVNIERSEAAGVAVGAVSEPDRPKQPKVRDRRSKRAAQKRKKLENQKKSKAQLKTERDALFGARRVPGSFENGKRR